MYNVILLHIITMISYIRTLYPHSSIPSRLPIIGGHPLLTAKSISAFQPTDQLGIAVLPA